MKTMFRKPVCTTSLKILGDYWTMMIIEALQGGPARFRDLEKMVEGVNTATLSGRLKSMHQSGLVNRKEQSRADVTYELTDLGRQAIPILDAVNDFAEYSNR